MRPSISRPSPVHTRSSSCSVRRQGRPAAWIAFGLLAALLMLGGCGAGSDSSHSSSPLVALQVQPAALTVPLNDTGMLNVVGERANGTSDELTAAATWSSVGDDVGTVAPDGSLTATASGVAVFTAKDSESGLQASTLVTVPGTTPVAIQLTGSSATVAVGLPLQLSGVGILSDGSRVDVTGLLSWSADQGGIVALGANGQLLGLGLGTTVITGVDPATGLRAQISIQVTPAVLQSLDVIASQLPLPLGLSQNLQAVGHLSDGSTVDLTSLVSWASGNPDVATVASGGLLTSLGAGSTLVTAADPASGIQGSLPLQVTPAVLQSLEVVPAQLSVLLGLVQPLTAVGHYSDGSTAELTNGVQWSSDNPLLAAVNSAGSVLGLGLGDTTVHAVEPQSGLKSGAAVSVLSALSGLLP